jgi:hypothetical protein
VSIELIILFIISIVITLIGTTLMLMSRKPGVSVADIYWKGSSVFRNLDKYIRPERVSIVRTLNVVGVLLFLVSVVGLLYANF